MEIPGRITSIDELESLFRPPGAGALAKQRDSIDDGAATFIDHCPFVVVATTNGADSIDASPRGGPPGFIRRLDDRHVAIPDLNGNNRLDTLRNVIAHAWAGLLLIAPGKDETLRINGRAVITNDADILGAFTTELRTPKLALVVETAEIYGHCAKAFRRGNVWQPDAWHRFAEAPDLAGLHASQWNLEPQEFRAVLEQAYSDELALD